jgi:PAS domain S-box-containing protein
MGRPLLRGYPFSYYLIGSIFLILMIAVAGLIGISYLSTEKTLEENAQLVKLQTENTIISHFKSKEETLNLYDKDLNQNLEHAFPPFLAAYDQAGGDPARMDLEAIKREIGGEMDLYIINDSATIIATTYPGNPGLNFSEFSPYFTDYGTTIRTSSGFIPDRILSRQGSTEMRKFAYMPTPDHRYILALGISNVTPLISNYQYIDENLIRKVKQSNPYLVQVRIFDATLQQRVNDTSVEIDDPAKIALLAGILANRTTIDIPGPDEGSHDRYLFIDLRNERYGSDASRIVELTYTDHPIHDALEESALYLLSLGLFALIICGLLTVFIIRILIHPIEKMVEDVNKISDGDLDHSITPPIGAELIRLEESITRMVGKMRDHIRLSESSEKRFMDLVQLLPQGIFEADLNGIVTFANPMAFELFGLTPEDLDQKISIFDMVNPENRDYARSQFIKILQGLKSEGTELSGIRKDGRTFPILIYTSANIQGGELIGIHGIVMDITRLKQIETELIDLNNELEKRVADRTRQLTEVNKNLESFTYTVSHDLRAPLRAISGYSSILLQDLEEIPEKDRKYLESLRQNAHDMGRLIDDLLDFSRLGMRSLEKGTVQPALLIRDILREIRTDPTSANVEFRVGDLPPCQADPGLLKQVYTNLVSNAVKFSRKRDHPVVEIGSLTENGRLIFFVRDNGIGLDMQYSDKIFGVFQKLQPSEEYEGTGIGLAIVQRIIEIHGGRIWVESEIDKGTTFYFTWY